ncbi:hypothetical protein L596_003086 [Steinernema carpocapsae]|uniref:ShKT domain-containing protein n=1 Tax=Steinernema carpocapsae TaxID=34508 RepID=A0A4U8URL9_STECR|nr:hypothetical protein L596_003086 [Steinernema carpocapsae]
MDDRSAKWFLCTEKTCQEILVANDLLLTLRDIQLTYYGDVSRIIYDAQDKSRFEICELKNWENISDDLMYVNSRIMKQLRCTERRHGSTLSFEPTSKTLPVCQILSKSAGITFEGSIVSWSISSTKGTSAWLLLLEAWWCLRVEAVHREAHLSKKPKQDHPLFPGDGHIQVCRFAFRTSVHQRRRRCIGSEERSENLTSANKTTDSSTEAPSAPTSEPVVEGDAQESLTESVETTTHTAAATELPPKDQQIVEGETANQSLQRIVSYNAVRAGTVNQVEGTAQISPQSQVSNDIVQQAAPEKKTTGEKSTETKVPEWRPFVMDCSNEDDDRGSELCMEWASGGLCTSNRPTMFLFCRKTCLCVGPRSN